MNLPTATHTNRNRNVIASPQDKLTNLGVPRPRTARLAVPAVTFLLTLAYGSPSTPLPRSAVPNVLPLAVFFFLIIKCYGNDSQLTYCEPRHNRALHLTFGFKIIELVPLSRQPVVGEP